MREAMIICPTTGNDGADLGEHITWARDAMVRAFGGCTMSGPDWGAWFDESADRVQEERVMRLTAACEIGPNSAQSLQIIARAFACSAKQKAVYIRFPDGRVQIIETEHLWKGKDRRVSTPGGSSFVA